LSSWKSLCITTESSKQLRGTGYEVIVSVGELEENKIGSNCGQYLKKTAEHEKL